MDAYSDRPSFSDPAPDHRDIVVRLFPMRTGDTASPIPVTSSQDRDEYELGGYAGI
ncbi:hypothetical protein FHW69_001327 [Luteibacter sp. Sphag1AF]|uniref:hypothetical protein n=1 Tax=Luteibacter sp. Sphag1AF TaxID=2587031 RepID=UPI0016190404|nr:hypothetical protein [Luteibacter sp. Sphag1AF]MBB3226737.1 hypothetical protein [Luteibacter sp. Sphag1AF]